VPLGFFFYNRERGGKNQNGLVVARFREVDCDGVVPMSPVGIVELSVWVKVILASSYDHIHVLKKIKGHKYFIFYYSNNI
jgi:hypothetical protein